MKKLMLAMMVVAQLSNMQASSNFEDYGKSGRRSGSFAQRNNHNPTDVVLEKKEGVYNQDTIDYYMNGERSPAKVYRVSTEGKRCLCPVLIVTTASNAGRNSADSMTSPRSARSMTSSNSSDDQEWQRNSATPTGSFKRADSIVFASKRPLSRNSNMSSPGNSDDKKSSSSLEAMWPRGLSVDVSPTNFRYKKHNKNN